MNELSVFVQLSAQIQTHSSCLWKLILANFPERVFFGVNSFTRAQKYSTQMSLVTFVYKIHVWFKVDKNKQPANAVRFHNLGQNLNSQ